MPSAAELLEALESEFPNTVQQRVRQYSLKDAYKTVSWVYACVNLIADSISGVEFFFTRPDSLGNSKDQLTDRSDPVVWCFYPPRPGEIPTIAEMIKMQFLHLGLFGESFMYLEKKGKYPVQIDLINPLNITPIISKDGTSIEKWRIRQQTPGGQQTEKLVPTSQIVQWKYPNPYNKFRGMAPLTAARLAVEQDLNMATWNAGFFQNGLRNPIALMLKQTFNEPQRKEYMNRMKQNFMGFVRGQLPLIVEGGVGVQVLQNTMKDLDFAQGKELTREELCAVYNVPPAMAGIFRYANYSNTKEQRVMLYQNTLRPKMVYYRDIFQQTILDVYFPGVVCDWEWEGIEAFKEDPTIEANVQNTTASTVQIYWEMGYTQAQIAYILKRPELDPATHVTAQPADLTLPEPEVEDQKLSLLAPRHSHSKDHVVIYASKAYLRAYAKNTEDEILYPRIQRLESVVAGYWDRLAKGCRGEINLRFWKEQWQKQAVPILRAVYDEGCQSAYRDLKQDPPHSKSEDLDVGYQAVETKVTQWGYTALVSVNKTISGVKGKAASQKIESLALPEKFPARALLYKLYNLGRFETMRRLGVEDIALCATDSHRALNGITVKLGLPFPTLDMQYPGETGSDSCTCTIYPTSVRKPERKVAIVQDLTHGA